MSVTQLHPDTDDSGRDPHVEAWLDGLHVEWTFEPAVDLGDVDHNGSLNNQARLHALDPDVVDRYTADMALGDQFPPVLAQRRPRRKLLLLGGNHRYNAAIKAKRPTLPMYVVVCEPETATRLMYEDNRRHGLPPSEDERIAQAIHLVETGWTNAKAAECVGVAAHKLQAARAAARADQRARRLKIDGFEQLPRSTRARLDGVQSDPVFAEASKLIVAAGIGSGKEMQDLVSRLNDTRSEADALTLIGTETEVLRQQIQQRAGGKGARPAATPRTKLIDAIGKLGGCDPVDVAAGCANKEQAQSLARMVSDSRDRLDATLKALRKRWP